MQHQFEQLKKKVETTLAAATDRAALEQLRVEMLGRKGELASLMKDMARLTEEERKVVGKMANEVKEAVEIAFRLRERKIAAVEQASQGEREWIDVTEPGRWSREGHLHPVSTAIAEITDVFSRVGFTRVRAPEIDWDFYAFESLNMPADHPARDDWETFFIAATGAQCGDGKKRPGRVDAPHVQFPSPRNGKKEIADPHDQHQPDLPPAIRCHARPHVSPV